MQTKNNILILLNFPVIIIIVLIVIILIKSKIKLIISYFIQCIKYIQIYKFYIKTTIKMHKKYKYLKCLKIYNFKIKYLQICTVLYQSNIWVTFYSQIVILNH